MVQILEKIPSNNLQSFTLSRADFGRDLIQYLKYSRPVDVMEISLKDRKYNRMIIDQIIVRNVAWTKLRRLDLSDSEIGDVCGARLGRNII